MPGRRRRQWAIISIRISLNIWPDMAASAIWNRMKKSS
jgi:hypothetical protein